LGPSNRELFVYNMATMVPDAHFVFIEDDCFNGDFSREWGENMFNIYMYDRGNARGYIDIP
jgi:hypothetical protein